MPRLLCTRRTRSFSANCSGAMLLLAHTAAPRQAPRTLAPHLVGQLDGFRHVLLDLYQLALQIAVYALKHDALPPQVVDLLPQLLVVRYALVELDVRALQPVLQQLDALRGCGREGGARVGGAGLQARPASRTSKRRSG